MYQTVGDEVDESLWGRTPAVVPSKRIWVLPVTRSREMQDKKALSAGIRSGIPRA